MLDEPDLGKCRVLYNRLIKELIMTNHIYYGEYSLNHWIELILKKDIILPDYQRSFVWDEADIARLIKSLQDKQFIQPVTIALYSPEGERTRNLIIDGQQRLTSILLAKLGYIPNKEKFSSEDQIADKDENDEENAVDLQEQNIGPIKWTFKLLLSDDVSKNSINEIKDRISRDDKYIIFNNTCNHEFFEKTFIGFSYVVPDSTNRNEIQRYFAQLFRSINYFGKRLSPLESRRSLYYMNSSLQPYFDGEAEDGQYVLDNIKIKDRLQYSKIDFVRYLSILSQYVGKGKCLAEVMKKYSANRTRESYYADYVSYLVGLDQEDNKDKFDGFSMGALFPHSEWKHRFSILKDEVKRLKKHFNLDDKGAFTSWIDADYWLFGLIYEVVFENRTLKEDIQPLVDEITKKISEKRDLDENNIYLKNPNRLSNLRDRLNDSIITYQSYVQ